MMNTFAILVLAAITAVTATHARAEGMEMSARVRTWGGADLTLSEAWVAALYTIPARPQNSEQGQNGGGTPSLVASVIPPASSGGGAGSSMGALGGGYGQADRPGSDKSASGPIQGIKTVETVTLRRGAVEYQVPISRLASLTFRRQAVQDSTLPPYFVPGHYRYAATAVLSDGSQVDADYVNLGTAMVRGKAAQGVIEVPWTEIEVVRFSR